jgi:hypothetical protein
MLICSMMSSCVLLHPYFYIAEPKTFVQGIIKIGADNDPEFVQRGMRYHASPDVFISEICVCPGVRSKICVANSVD